MQSRELLKKLPIEKYLVKVYEIIEHESKLTEYYFDKQTLSPLISTLENCLITDH